MKRAPFDVMVIVDPRIDGVLDGLSQLSDRASGERIAIQLRAKDASEAELFALARAVAAVQPAMSRLIVNDRATVARAIAADGVHLPEIGGRVEAARRAMSSGALVGCSCHDAAGVAQRASEGADYVMLGPLGEVPGKPPLSADAFRTIASAARVPIVALGGIASREDADRAMALGASAIAVQRALVDPSGPAWIAAWLTSRA